MAVPRSRSAEFPNDNPALHEGAVWICRSPCELPRPVVRPTTATEPVMVQQHEPVAEPEPATAACVAIEPEPAPAACVAIEPEPAPALPPDPFAGFVDALVSAAMEAGATRAAALLPAMLEHGRLDDTGLDAAAVEALIAGGVATRVGPSLRAAEGFAATARAWCAVLRGLSDDLSACGASTLDGWAADLLARLLGAPERGEVLRRELRRHGVAAFGMLDLAA